MTAPVLALCAWCRQWTVIYMGIGVRPEAASAGSTQKSDFCPCV